MRIARAAHVNRPADAPPLIFAPLPIFLCLEDRQNVRETPSRRAILCPAVKVALHAAAPHQCVDAGAAPEYVAQGHVEVSVVEARTRLYREMVVERAAQIVEPNARAEDGGSIVVPAGFDDQNLCA